MGRSERWQYRSLYLTRLALDRVAEELGVDEVPYFTRNTFADPDLIEAFLGMHLALEEGRDVFRERELLIGSFGTLFQRPTQYENRIDAAHLRKNRNRCRPCCCRIHQRPPARARAGEPYGLYERMFHQGNPKSRSIDVEHRENTCGRPAFSHRLLDN
jgi:hypothetical protein